MSAFKTLLTDPGDWRASIDGLSFSRINDEEANRLEVPFSKEEVHSALCEMNGDKAPGSDGFTIAFWQLCWNIVKDEIMRMFRELYNSNKFARSLNTAFLVMIPKKDVVDLKDFRPISLVGSLYKLLAKVLANRLKQVMGSLVNKA